MTTIETLAAMDGRKLLALMKRITAAERTLSVYALAQLGEIQRRKLFEDAGYTTMFLYCVKELGYSEPTAYRRLQAADAARRFPEVLSLLKDGALTVCALAILAKHLTRENGSALLKRVENKGLRFAERVAAEIAPKPDKRDLIRTIAFKAFAPAQDVRPEDLVQAGSIGEISPAAPTAAAPSEVLPSPSAEAAPQSAVESALPAIAAHSPEAEAVEVRPFARTGERVFFAFTGSAELRTVIKRCSDLLWRKHPDGKLEDILLEVGLTFLKQRDRELLPSSTPKPARAVERRNVVRWVRSLVYKRDGGRCMFIGLEGVRCDARRGLEYDHIVPWAKGGRSGDPNNIRLLCRAHNLHAARAAGLA